MPFLVLQISFSSHLRGFKHAHKDTMNIDHAIQVSSF